MTVLAARRVVTPGDVVDHGWVEIADGRIGAVGRGSRTDVDAQFPFLVPGFLDLHVHGGGGHDASASPAGAAGAVAFHRGHGTTATLLSLVTDEVDALCAQLAWIADLAEAPGSGVLGAHLEGPYLSEVRRGAHRADLLRAPDPGITRALLAAGRGHVRCMTFAPELPGAVPLIDQLREAGVVAAVGHTDATYAQTRAAFARGATLATHLYNGMRPVHHREPGPVLAALDAGAVCEVVHDGEHVHPAVLREVEARGAGRLALVTDAVAAAGAPDGAYSLGGLEVDVAGGVARLRNDGSLAGSTLTLDAALRHAVHDGLPLERAVAAVSSTPAAVLGLAATHGTIAPGRRADLVALDEHLRPLRVFAGGEPVG